MNYSLFPGKDLLLVRLFHPDSHPSNLHPIHIPVQYGYLVHDNDAGVMFKDLTSQIKLSIDDVSHRLIHQEDIIAYIYPDEK